MIRVSAFEDVAVHVFHKAGTEHPNQDRWLVTESNECLRLAVIDGVTPWRAPPDLRDSGAYAAEVCVAELCRPVALVSALYAANAQLHRQKLLPPRRQPSAAVAAVDLVLLNDGFRVSIAVAADGEVWCADSEGELHLAAGGDFLVPEARQELTALRAELVDRDDLTAAEADLLADPATQVCHPVGAYAQPVLGVAQVRGASVVLATDGAQIGEAVDAGLRLAQIPAWLSERGRVTPRDDITCLIAVTA